MPKSKFRFVAALTTGLMLSTLSAQAGPAQSSQTPLGLDFFAVFMATGTIPFAPHPNPQIAGCGVSIFCDGDYFHQMIMGRDAAATAAEAQRAKDYFLTRFGVDVDDLVAQGRMSFDDFFLDPRGEYRAYTIAGAKIHPDGWVVRDGGFVATVLDPAGVTLQGEFAGQGLIAPPGGLLVWGSYNILAAAPSGQPRGEVVIDYRSHMPMIANTWEELVVNCQLSLDGFASGERSGKAQGMGTVALTPDFSGVTLSWRNVLTVGGLDL